MKGRTLSCFWLLITVLRIPNSDGIVCISIDARNNFTALEQLRGCTVVEGFVKIVLMEKRFEEADFEPYSFPELREVTQYMLFYRVQGLRSLGKLFPNLEKIGGADLFEDFALVIFEMFSLQEVGLTNLREITKGSVNIVKNPNLCFVDTVKWDNITRWNVVRNYDVQNRDAASCPGCPDHCQFDACWNTTHCQFEPEDAGTTRGPSECHPLCGGRCHSPGPRGCYSCKGFYDLENNCVQSCPPNTYVFLNRRCVTREGCTSMKISTSDGDNNPGNLKHSTGYYVIYESQCLEECPAGYETEPSGVDCRPCREGRCQKWCDGAVITSTGEAQRLRGCTHICGSIEITIKSETSGSVHSVLEENLGSIEHISGYLQVTRSSVKDLNFLKNLSVIHGKDMNKQKFALVIINNDNLQELWNWTMKRNFTIAKGCRLYFHYNPKLCLNHIDKLLDVIGYDKNVSSFEIGKESNGDKFSCNAIVINVTVIDRTSNRIDVHVPYTEIIPILRYVVYYAKDPFKNVTMFDDLDQCSDYGWRTKDSVDSDESDNKVKGFRVNLTDLEPYTTYIFYVTTYTIYSVSARSRLHRETTLPSTPSELTRLQANATSSSEIELQWEPPKHINGKLQEYVVTWYELKEDRTFIDRRNYCHYPMAPERNIYDLGNIRPRFEVHNKSCCSAPQYLPKDGFEFLCNHFSNVQFPIGFPDKTKYLSCESYFYSYIYNRPDHPSNRAHNKTLPIFSKTNYIKMSSFEKLGRNKNGPTYQNLIPDYDPKAKSKITRKALHLPPSSRKVVLKGLNNFQNYVISVKACREEQRSGLENNRCSSSEIVTVRTRENNESDAILQNTVLHDVKKGTLTVEWKPPEHPNGVIVAFEIEYRHRNLENPKQKKECITHSQYENSKNQHFIDGLLPGKYEFRVRAISLSGEGPFTTFTAFDVGDRNNMSLLEIFVITLTVSVVLLVVFVSLYLLKPSTYKIVIADVNPNYHYVPDHYEIDRDDVEFGRELGIGSFGKVYEGRWKSKNLNCAIKTVNDDATMDDEKEFLMEASVMKAMTNAYFLVGLFGVVSKGRPPLVLMELMEHGDLKTYLREMRNVHPITNATMIKMALEIADGMSYIEIQKFVHRDLAARNCMVSSELTVKVGDFGMARDIYENDYYRKRNKGFLPIRWMAPESLNDGEFTSKSDIWSYGVVLWEIVTMAEQPYQGSSNDEVLHDVIAGRRLEIPKTSPLPLKTLMMMCWRTKPAKRRSFMNIVTTLEYYHDEEFRRVAYYHSKEAVTTRKGLWEYVEMQPVGDPPYTTYRLVTEREETIN